MAVLYVGPTRIEIEMIRARLEDYLHLQPGALGENASPRPVVVATIPQDATREVDGVVMVPGKDEQVAYDIWRLLQAARAAAMEHDDGDET